MIIAFGVGFGLAFAAIKIYNRVPTRDVAM